MSASLSSQTPASQSDPVYGKKGKESTLYQGTYRNGLQVTLLFLLGASLLLTNRWFTEVDDECAIIDRAAQPIFQTVRLYLSGAGEHEHPPLYDVILHGWLQLTRGEQHLLRFPAIIFYIAGAWVLASAAKRRAGSAAGTYTLLLIFFWPYGFHFGRLATWYSFCFLLVALVTWNYLRYLESPRLGTWCGLVACAVLLIYSNYFAWALVGCLAVDFIIQNGKMPPKRWAGLAATCLLLLVAYVPLAWALFAELHGGVQPTGRVWSRFLVGIYDLYCVFASESVAPWFWALGVPVAAAIVICILITFASVPRQTKRLLVYFAGLLAAMSLLGIANTKRMLFISPWLILPVGVALAGTADKSLRRILSGALLFIAAVGWYGIFSRNLYAAPHWVEPWQTIGQNAANVAHDGGIVIGNNPSLFFYLTYDVAPGAKESARRFAGLLPDSTRRPNIYSPPQWLEADRPLAPQMLLVKGPHYQIPSGPMEESQQWLDQRCVLRNSERMVHDPGAGLKEHFGAETGQIPWRIEILSYSCR
jgi:Dolichyl-phosphate-mannose-protein mannosyltransferase